VYLLDTDILSILQIDQGVECDRVRSHINDTDPRLVFVSIVSFHEQLLGWNAYLQRAKSLEGMVHGYGKFERLLLDFSRLNVASFDQQAASQYDQLKSQNTRIGTMDLRIAAVGLANDYTVVTRNTVDFKRVPGLRIEDWTAI
jgi:tRNA(fMet)-specific endonuclease VapC